jgi:hypothetical protein
MKFWLRILRRKPAPAAPRPVVFVDIDGVLAPLAMREGLEVAHVGGWQGTVVYDPAVIAYLRRWHEEGLAEVRWLTSWDDDANTCFAPQVGLPTFFVHPEPLRSDGRGWWKEAVVCHHLYETPRRVVWLEDEAADSPAARLVAEAEPHRALIIVPDDRVGLTVADCAVVEEFLRRPAV